MYSPTLQPSAFHQLRLNVPRKPQTQMLDNGNMSHLDRAADLIAAGEIVAFGFNSVFAFVGDVDQEIAALRMAHAKNQSVDKTLALVCPPECLEEFVDPADDAVQLHGFRKIQRLQRRLHGLGVVMPVSPGILPHYAQQSGTALNVWFEMPPYSPARYLHERLRALGVRAMIGTSARQHGEATYVDPEHVSKVFDGQVAAIVAHDLATIPMHRRMSSTLVDFTGALPRLLRRGSVPTAELRHEMQRLGMKDIHVQSDVSNAGSLELQH